MSWNRDWIFFNSTPIGTRRFSLGSIKPSRCLWPRLSAMSMDALGAVLKRAPSAEQKSFLGDLGGAPPCAALAQRSEQPAAARPRCIHEGWRSTRYGHHAGPVVALAASSANSRRTSASVPFNTSAATMPSDTHVQNVLSFACRSCRHCSSQTTA